VRGEGKVFSAGADVQLFAGKGAGEMRPLIASFLDLGRRIEALSFPTLAAVHGTCMAGGFELALLHDSAAAIAGSLASGPSDALAVLKRVARAYAREGVAGADALLLDVAVPLFDTEDARSGIETFLTTGKTPWP
jgi:enoyl-CoA hydratase/carnithine racemase